MHSKEEYLSSSQIGLSNEDLEKIRTVFSTFANIACVWLYGSRAIGNFNTYSDIDITLEGQDLDLDVQYQVVLMLDDLYLPYTFDVSILSQISNQDLLEHIARVGKILYRRTVL